MADATKPRSAEPQPDPPAPRRGRQLAPAGESGDPEVQRLLAERQTAVMNRAALDVEAADIEAADAAVRVADERLADLGFH
jgi:hypothetical protein